LVPRWTPSSAKHGISQADAAYAIQNHNFSIEFGKLPGDLPHNGARVLFIGPQHRGTDREIEVLVEMPANPGDQVVIFHVMPLGAKYRALRESYIDEQR
jgi:hypothetical protein